MFLLHSSPLGSETWSTFDSDDGALLQRDLPSPSITVQFESTHVWTVDSSTVSEHMHAVSVGSQLDCARDTPRQSL